MSTYTVLMHAAANTRFAVYKTTGDPNDQGTWAVVANSEIDFTNEVYSLWAVKDGTHIHIVTQEAVTGRVAYHDFNTGTDTWTTENETIDAITSAADDEMGCSIALRSDGDVVVIYSEASATGVQWAREEGAGWTLADLGGNNTHAGVLVLGSSDRIHALYVDTTSTDVQSRTIRSDNSLSTEAQAHTSIDAIHGIGTGVSYDDEGTQRVRVPVQDNGSNDVDIIEFDSADSPSFGSTGSISTNNVAVVNGTVVAGLSVHNKNLQLLFIDTPGFDILRDQNDDDAGWGTDEQVVAGTFDRLSSNVITRGGLALLGYISRNSSNVVIYREIILAVETASTFANAQLPQQNYYVGPFKNGSDYYTVLHQEDHRNIFTVYTATSPLSSWSAVASSSILLSADILSLWIAKDGSNLHVITMESGGRVAYHLFNMSTEVWDVEDDEVATDSTASNAQIAVSIGVRSGTGVPVITYPLSDTFTNWGRRESSVWTTNALLASLCGVLVPGISDSFHHVARDHDASQLMQRTILSSNALGVSQGNIVSDVAAEFHVVGPPSSYDDGGTIRCRVPYKRLSSGDVSILEFDSATAPTYATSLDVSENTVEVANDTILAALSVQTKELQLLYVDVTGDDIYLDKNNDDAGWGTDTQEIISTVVGMSQNSIESVISVIYQISGGDLTYAEIGVVAPSGNLLLSHPPRIGCEL